MGGWRRALAGAAATLAVLALGAPPPAAGQAGTPKTWNTELVGHVAPPQGGGYADV